MPKRDTITKHSAIVADWYARVRETKRRNHAKDFPDKLVIALTGPQYDTSEFKSAVASIVGASHTPAELKAVALFLKLGRTSRVKAFALIEMAQRNQLPELRSLPEEDKQLLSDSFDLSETDGSLKFGGNYLRAAKAIKKRNRKRYDGVTDEALTQRLKRAHQRFKTGIER